MTRRLRKLALTAHINSSVGWIGAVAGFLALGVAGLTSEASTAATSAYVAMDLVTTYVIVPLALVSLASGVAQSLGTPWGLFRHYWVIVKLVITVLSTAILLLHTEAIRSMANLASRVALATSDERRLRIQLVADAGAALVALVFATFLAVYKPRGETSHRRKRGHAQRTVATGC